MIHKLVNKCNCCKCVQGYFAIDFGQKVIMLSFLHILLFLFITVYYQETWVICYGLDKPKVSFPTLYSGIVAGCIQTSHISILYLTLKTVCGPSSTSEFKNFEKQNAISTLMTYYIGEILKCRSDGCYAIRWCITRKFMNGSEATQLTQAGHVGGRCSKFEFHSYYPYSYCIERSFSNSRVIHLNSNAEPTE